MEPRARAGKNVGKETFTPKDIRNLLYAFGDVENPLPETIRVLDEIVTEFLEGICFEASRHAQVAGRQKLKFDDFEFALRRSPEYLGKVRSMIDKRQHITKMRKTFDQDDSALLKEHEGGAGGKENGGRSNGIATATADADELVGLSEDDEDEVGGGGGGGSRVGGGSRKAASSVKGGGAGKKRKLKDSAK